MNNFSISQLQQFSGIKAHTIRIWEQRYNALTPNRSVGNTRYYDNDQLRRLLNIVSLMDEYKVSALGAMPDTKLFDLIKNRLALKAEDSSASYFIAQLLSAGISYDVKGFDKIFTSCIEKYGIRDTYVHVIYPLLDRIGLMWSSDTIPPAQEHFISNMIRQKLFAAIDELPPARSKESWVLFLPEKEFHEIGLLFSHFLIRLAGKRVVYLGSNVPLSTLAIVIKTIVPTNMLLFCVHNDEPWESENYCRTLSVNFPGVEICISGNEKLISGITREKSIKWIRSVEELEKELI